jgi:hypothetical protein
VPKISGSVLLAIAFLWPLVVLPQNVPPPQLPPIVGPRPEEPAPDIPSSIRKEMEKKANQQRQADLKRDTDKLLKLSTELKDYVDKSNENILSVDVIKKADEIEKLAHSVKMKMRGDN